MGSDTSNIGRRPNRHLSFGLGIHVFINNTLARIPGIIAFAKLFDRFSGLQLVPPARLSSRAQFLELEESQVQL